MDKLESLLKQLDEIEIDFKDKQLIHKHNLNTVMLRIPKVILLQRISPFLDDKDLYNLTATCTTLRKIVFCPIGFKLLIMSRNANHIIGAKPQLIKHEKEEKIDLSMFGSESSSQQVSYGEEEDAIAQLYTLRSVKDFLTLKLRESVGTINKLEDVLDNLNTSLKFEKSVNLKLQSKINILQNQLSTSELQRQDAKENLSELNSKYNKIISQMEMDKKQLQDDKDQLLGHKKILIEEVYRLRAQVSELQQTQLSYKDALQQVKTFMDSVDIKPLQQQLQQ